MMEMTAQPACRGHTYGECARDKLSDRTATCEWKEELP